MSISEIEKVEVGTILKLGSSYYLVGEFKEEGKAMLYHCDKEGNNTHGNIGNVKLNSYSFKIVGYTNKVLKEAEDF